MQIERKAQCILRTVKLWMGNKWDPVKLSIILFIHHFFPQEHELLSYSSTRTKAPSVIISGLKPAAWYVFSVRTRTPAGYSSYSPKYEYETTGDCEYLRPAILCVLNMSSGVFVDDDVFSEQSYEMRKIPNRDDAPSLGLLLGRG